MQQMTPQQALEILDAIAARMPGTREDHAVAQQATATLAPLVIAFTEWQKRQAQPEPTE